MPYIHLQILKGATREQKKGVVEDFTASLVKHLGKKPEHIHIVIDEIEEENWGFSGMLTDDYRRSLDAPAADASEVSGSGGTATPSPEADRA